jgi:IS605 OrfB family transposase
MPHTQNSGQALSTWLRYEPDALPAQVCELLMTWRRTHGRRYRELHNIRVKALGERKHQYRQVADQLVRNRKPIGIEKINLNAFAQTKDAENKLGNKPRANRFLVSVSELRGAIKNAAQREGVPLFEIDPAYTSKTCSGCGYRNNSLQSEQRWTCPACRVEHDRDENAAVNIARKALEKYNEVAPKESADEEINQAEMADCQVVSMT